MAKKYSTVSDVATGIVSGATVGLLQGLGETGALLTDLAFDTNNAQEVTNFFEELKEKLDLDPETPAGEIAETITPFLLAGIPVVGWAGIASKVAQGKKVADAGTFFGKTAQNFGRSDTGKLLLGGEGFVSNLKRGTAISGGTAFADFMIAPSTNQTLTDSFDTLGEIAPFFETDGDTGLVGREDAFRKLKNKLKIGGESFVLGAGLTGGIETAVSGTGLIGSGIGEVNRRVQNIPLPPNAAQESRTVGSVVSDGFSVLGDTLNKVPFVSMVGNDFKNLFASSGVLEKQIFERIKDAGGLIDEDAKIAVSNMAAYDRAVRKTIGGFWANKSKEGKTAYERSYSDLMDFLEGNTKALDGVDPITGKPVYDSKTKLLAAQMADARNRLSSTVHTQIKRQYDNGLIDIETYNKFNKIFVENENSYLRQIYEGGLNSDRSLASVLRSPRYNQALKEVKRVMTELDPERYAGASSRLDEEAETFLKKMILKDRFEDTKVVSASLDPKAVGPRKNSFFGNKTKQVDESRIPLHKVSEGLLESRNPILERSPLTRSLMGEVKEGRDATVARYLQTISDMSALANANKLYGSLLDDPNITKTTTEYIEGLKAGSPSRPLILDGPTSGLGQDVLQQIKNNDYVLLPTNPKSIFGGAYGDLGGKFVARELVDTISIKPINTTFGGGFAGGAWALGVRAKSASQIANTVFSPTSQIRNFLGGPFFLLANGHVPRGGDMIDAIDLTMNKVSKMTDEEYASMQAFLSKSGLSNSSAIINEIRDTFKGRRVSGDVNTSGSVTGFTRDMLEKAMGPEVTAATKAATKKTGEAITAPVKKLFDIYSGTDTVFKTTAVMSEKARLASALRNTILAGSGRAKATIDDADFNLIADDLVDQGVALRNTNLDGDNFLDVAAADITKATMPMYDRVPKAFAFFRDLPIVGNFVSFTSEIFRNSANIIRQGANELAFVTTPQLEAKLGNRIAEKVFGDVRLASDEFIAKAGRDAGLRLQREMNAIGLKRLSGFTTSAFVATPAVAAGTAALLELPQSILDSLDREKPFFFQGHTLVPLGKPDEDGKIKYTTISYYSPYATIAAIPKRFMEEYSRQGRLGKDTADQAYNAVYEAFGLFLQPFTEEALLAERLGDVTFRKGRTRQGRKLYETDDDPEEKWAKSIGHILGAVTPTVIRDFVDVEQFNPVSGTLKTNPGRVTLAIENAREKDRTVYGKTDRDYQPGEEALRYLMGMTTMEMDSKENLGYSAIEYNSSRNQSIRSEANRNFRRANLTREDLVDSYADVTEELFKAQQELYLSIQDNKILGDLRDKDVKELLTKLPAVRNAVIPKKDYEQIEEGLFSPVAISEESMESEEERLDRRDIEYEYSIKRRMKDQKKLERKASKKLEKLRLDEEYPKEEMKRFFEEYKIERFGTGVRSDLQTQPQTIAQTSIAPQTPNVPVLSQPLSPPSAPPAAPLPTATGPQASLDPELLGDNPIEQARNMELARRTRNV